MIEILGWVLATSIRYSLFVVEALLMLACLVWAHLTWADAAGPAFRRLERAFAAVARRRRLAVVLPGILALAIRIVLLPLMPPRLPRVPDEFSYLLAADTFSLGRLANPAHPFWMHFESMHILQQPVYASMYHAAQGLVLAAAKVCTGYEWAGVLLSTAIMCSLVCWMLQGWLPPRWAFLGGLLAVARLALFSYWGNSYWGGSVAACGGLLLLGALPRIQRVGRPRDAYLLALGLAILANSRPYEGLVLGVAAMTMLATWWRRQASGERRLLLTRVGIPILAVLTVAGAATSHYYASVTGNPFRMPYQVNRDTYAPARIFYWQQPLAVPDYRHESMRRYYVDWELAEFNAARTVTGAARNALDKLSQFWIFFLGPAFMVPLLFLPRVVRSRRLRPLLAVGAFFFAMLALNVWFYPHYAAPATGLIYAILVQGLRHLRARGRGLYLLWGWVAACFLLAAMAVPFRILPAPKPLETPMPWYYTPPGNLQRAGVAERLAREPGRHLVFVRYQPGHDFFREWVYNGADIDRSQTVWARQIGPEPDRRLTEYFRDRRIWVVEADLEPLAVTELTRVE